VHKSSDISFRHDENENTLIIKDSSPPCCILTIFGATGDLARNRIFPALYGLAADAKIPEDLVVVGFSHTDRTNEDFRRQITESLQDKLGPAFDEAIWQKVTENMQYIRGDFSKGADYRNLAAGLKTLEQERDRGENRLFYLATPSHFFPVILRNLHGVDLIHPATAGNHGPWTRLVIEKPFGSDLESARELNRTAEDFLDESQIFRVDHYLAKETVQNILIFRFANSIFEPVWNRMHIDHIEITAAEDFGIGSRGSFYDKTGVVRDVIQNHILQLLALIAMDTPSSFSPNDFHLEKRKIFRLLRPLTADDLQDRVLLGQYRGYRDEAGVDGNSNTPTYAALKVFIDSWRWQNVPFYIRAGKSLSRRLTEIAVHFRTIPTCLFGDRETCQNISPNVLCLRIQPEEGIRLSFSCKQPGDHLEVAKVDMNFTYAGTFSQKSRPAYERLLLDCMRGDQTLFAEAKTLEEQWKFVAPILGIGSRTEVLPVHPYDAGSPGPGAAQEFISRDGRSWRELG
jgi:glucose-6-phosphate 1-dehydrogenase